MRNKVLFAVGSYLHTLGDATSQWVNVAFLFSANANESISGRAYRLENTSVFWKYARIVIDYVMFWDPQHCKSSYLADYQRAKRLIEGE